MRQDGVMQQPRNFSLYGAVDLGARQAAAQRQQTRGQQTRGQQTRGQQTQGQQTQGQQASRAEGDGGAKNGYVFDVSEAAFETDVLERSRNVPVVMDLWAEWCGPCKQLSPVLEKLAAEAAGSWVLAKVDVDANPQLSAALQVQSIPMVVGVVGGQLVPGFLGALPEPQVRQWLGQLLQVAKQLGLPGGDAGAEPGTGDDTDEADGQRDPEITEAQQAMERGDLAAAAAAFERLSARSPGNPVAAMGLAQVSLFQRVKTYNADQARRDAAGNPADVDAQCKVADIEMSQGKAAEAFDRLLGAVRRSSGEDRNKARLHLIGLFDIFPPRDPRVTKARATLSSLLF
jgi:thioredoxin